MEQPVHHYFQTKISVLTKLRHKFLRVGGRDSLPLLFAELESSLCSICLLMFHQSWFLPPPFDRNCFKVTTDLLTAKFNSFFSSFNAKTSLLHFYGPLPYLLC